MSLDAGSESGTRRGQLQAQCAQPGQTAPGVLAHPERYTAIQSDPNKIATYTGRASVYEAQGKGDIAMADLRKATSLAPRSIFDTMAQAGAKKRNSSGTRPPDPAANGEHQARCHGRPEE